MHEEEEKDVKEERWQWGRFWWDIFKYFQSGFLLLRRRSRVTVSEARIKNVSEVCCQKNHPLERLSEEILPACFNRKAWRFYV